MAYADELKRGNIAENWLFKFANDNSGFLYFAFSDVTYSSNFYHGVILNKPSIRESIDLATSTSKTSNVSITIPDFSYQGSPISEELFGGSNHYINQVVTIHSLVNGQVSQIGSCRLIDISSNGDKVNLSLTSHRPWDFINIPNLSTKEGTYFPVVYGNFQYETSTAASPQFCDNSECYPIPVNEIKGDDIICLLPFGSGFGASDSDPVYETPHYYDESLDIFIPFEPIDNTSADYQNGEAVTAPTTLKRSFKWNDVTEGASNTWGSFHNLTDDTNYATASVSTSGESGTDSESLFIDVKQPSGYFTTLVVGVDWRVVVSSVQHVSSNPYIRLKMESPTGSNLKLQYLSGTTTGSATVNIQANSDGTIPPIEFEVKAFTNDAGENISGSAGIKAFYISGTTSLNEDEPDNLNKTLMDLKQLYAGVDSTPKSWTSGTATLIHEAHRDILIRATGMTTSDPDGWSTVNTAKANWEIRWWQLEPMELQKILEKLQYEGGFIFRYKPNGDPHYITVPSSPSATATLTKDDLSDVTVKPSPFSELLTKSEIEFKRHPSNKKYLDFFTYSNDTARTNWNIQTKENISNVTLDALISKEGHATHSGELDEELDNSETQIKVDANSVFTVGDIIRIDDEEMLVTSKTSTTFINVTRGYRKTKAVTHADDSDILILSFTPISDFASYYDNIFGDITLIMNASIVNPKYFTLEVGDVVSFSDMYPVKAYNTSWSGLKFMITSTTRSLGTLKFEARKI